MGTTKTKGVMRKDGDGLQFPHRFIVEGETHPTTTHAQDGAVADQHRHTTEPRAAARTYGGAPAGRDLHRGLVAITGAHVASTAHHSRPNTDEEILKIGINATSDAEAHLNPLEIIATAAPAIRHIVNAPKPLFPRSRPPLTPTLL